MEPVYNLAMLAKVRSALKRYNQGERFECDKSSVTEAIVLLSMKIVDQIIIEGEML